VCLVRTFVGRRYHLVSTLRFLAALGSLVWLGLGHQWLRGIRRIPVLEDVLEAELVDRSPPLSIVLAARDEERSVKESVASILAQDYPGMLEVIAVNDRSTDRTGELLEELATSYPDRLRVLNVESLPEGWLGKTHALYTGATRATGEWLLFTDADVNFSENCADRAVRYATGKGLDHLTLPPEILCRSVLLRSFVAAFTLVFEMTQRPWRVGDVQAREHVGVGAFNLIRKDAYEKSGTHRAIRMRPDDDMKLAKLLKRGGFRQGVAYGVGLISVEWHQTLPDAVRGLSKSMFSGLDYRIGATLAGCADARSDQRAPCLRTPLARCEWNSLQAEPTLDLPNLRLPGQILWERYAVVVRWASSRRCLRLHLRHAQVRIHHARRWGNRVAGHPISPEDIEGQCDLIRRCARLLRPQTRRSCGPPGVGQQARFLVNHGTPRAQLAGRRFRVRRRAGIRCCRSRPSGRVP
jgi:hypothetical protein